MTEQLNTEQVKYFIRSLHEEYEKNSFLRDWCNVDFYLENDPRPFNQNLGLIDESEEETDFIQIGHRTRLPVDIIRKPQLSQNNVHSLIRGITLGERNYVIRQLDDAARDGELGKFQPGDFEIENLVRGINQVNNPEHLIMPLRDDLRDSRRKLRQSDRYQFMSNEYIFSDYSAVNVHWYPPEKDENVEGHGYIIGSNAIQLTQKWHGDSKAPKGFQHNEKFDKFSQNRPLMVYLGEEIEIDEESDETSLRERIDFLNRIVLSRPNIDSSGVLQIPL